MSPEKSSTPDKQPGNGLGPILIGIPGLELDVKTREQLQHPAVGGVVLFTRNYSSPTQIKQLVADIHACRSPRLLVAIDQEGGRVQRLREGFTALPPLGKLGQVWQQDQSLAADYAYRHGRVMAGEMLGLGIDLSFAPVLDLDRGSCVIGDRAFSADLAAVSDLGSHYLAGMHDAGMKTTGKHFPGHGSVLADSHVDDVVDARSFAEIESTDLQAFIQLQYGLDALMIAHVVYPDVDELPAGYSATWLQEILRQKLKYRGVIMSDDLGMHAAFAVGDLPARLQRCLAAGCELVLVCRPEDVEELLPSINQPLADMAGRIASLYGEATLAGADLALAAQQGAGEWQHWRQSLESLNTTA
ncbi:MAG TPA: beta-N-acetylhexosaminidase [Xanthomonadales bacterium]|nr:beta-N-acetylhexosaminidase [Xanthomonadales bacterium]